MKTILSILFFLGVCVSVTAQSQTTVVSDLNVLRSPNYGQFLKTGTTNTVPEQLVATNLWCRRAVLLGKKSYRTNNTGNVWIGVTSTNDQQPFLISSGGEAKLEAPLGCKINLKNWYLDVATELDGIVVIYDKD